jgi:hypothetical protein
VLVSQGGRDLLEDHLLAGLLTPGRRRRRQRAPTGNPQPGGGGREARLTGGDEGAEMGLAPPPVGGAREGRFPARRGRAGVRGPGMRIGADHQQGQLPSAGGRAAPAVVLPDDVQHDVRVARVRAVPVTRPVAAAAVHLDGASHLPAGRFQDGVQKVRAGSGVAPAGIAHA